MAQKAADGATGTEPMDIPKTAEQGPETAVSQCDTGKFRVRLRSGSRRAVFIDSQTHIVIGRDWQEVEATAIGPGTRREIDVEIEPVRGAARQTGKER